MKTIRNILLSRQGTSKVLFSLATIGCFMLIFRMTITNTLFYIFLVWNLILAIVPLYLSYYAQDFYKRNKVVLVVPLIFLWLIFFPNSPYIITDVIHLHKRPFIPVWYDGLLIFIFSATGLLSGLISLYNAHGIINQFTNKTISWLIILFISSLSGYGIYLGRVLRWNSWDLFIQPISVIQSMIESLNNKYAFGMMGIFTVIIIFTYLILYHAVFANIKNKPV